MTTVEEWVEKQDKNILQEILDHGDMIVGTCDCNEGICTGYRLYAKPLLWAWPEAKIVWDKNGKVTA